jgi:RNA polymerase sigma-70 factor (ECF subfamily)
MFFLLLAFIRSTTPQPNLQEDEVLLQEIARGKSSALGALYDRYSHLVYSLTYAVVNDEGLAEEISQEVFLQVWNKAATYQPGLGKVSTWVSSIARHRAIDQLRRLHSRPEGHRVEWEESDDSEEPGLVDPVGIEMQVDSALESRVLLRAIRQLPKEQQHVLALAYFQGLSHLEIAEATGEPLGTIKTRIRLAMQKLRTALRVPLGD